MLENLVASILNKFLSGWIKNLNSGDLRLGLFSGDIVLRSLEVRPDALSALHPALAVKRGTVGSIVVRVPWRKLTEAPTVVEVSDVFILGTPRGDTTIAAESIAERIQRELAAKLAQLETFDATEIAKRLAAAKITGDESTKEAGKESGFVQRMILSVLANVRVQVSNVHVRIEDPSPASAVALGVVLRELSVSSTNAAWEPCRVRVDKNGHIDAACTDTLGRLLKLGKLGGLGLYVDTRFAAVTPVADAAEAGGKTGAAAAAFFTRLMTDMVPPADPALAATVGLHTHQYLLRPVDALLKLRVTPDFKPVATGPQQCAGIAVDVVLPQVAVDITSVQLSAVMAQLKAMNALAAARGTGAAAAAAAQAAATIAAEVPAETQREFTGLYLRRLCAPGAGEASPADLARLADMDKQMSLPVALAARNSALVDYDDLLAANPALKLLCVEQAETADAKRAKEIAKLEKKGVKRLTPEEAAARKRDSLAGAVVDVLAAHRPKKPFGASGEGVFIEAHVLLGAFGLRVHSTRYNDPRAAFTCPDIATVPVAVEGGLPACGVVPQLDPLLAVALARVVAVVGIDAQSAVAAQVDVGTLRATDLSAAPAAAARRFDQTLPPDTGAVRAYTNGRTTLFPTIVRTFTERAAGPDTTTRELRELASEFPRMAVDDYLAPLVHNTPLGGSLLNIQAALPSFDGRADVSAAVTLKPLLVTLAPGIVPPLMDLLQAMAGPPVNIATSQGVPLSSLGGAAAVATVRAAYDRATNVVAEAQQLEQETVQAARADAVGASNEGADGTGKSTVATAQTGLDNAARVLRDHRSVAVNVSMAAPTVIIPQSSTRAEAPCLALDLGTFFAESRLLNETERARVEQLLKAGDTNELKKFAYDRYAIGLRGVRVYCADTYASARRLVESDSEPTGDGPAAVLARSAQLVAPFSVAVNVDLSFASSCLDIPLVQLEAKAEALRLHLSNVLLQRALGIVDVFLPPPNADTLLAQGARTMAQLEPAAEVPDHLITDAAALAGNNEDDNAGAATAGAGATSEGAPKAGLTLDAIKNSDGTDIRDTADKLITGFIASTTGESTYTPDRLAAFVLASLRAVFSDISVRVTWQDSPTIISDLLLVRFRETVVGATICPYSRDISLTAGGIEISSPMVAGLASHVVASVGVNGADIVSELLVQHFEAEEDAAAHRGQPTDDDSSVLRISTALRSTQQAMRSGADTATQAPMLRVGVRQLDPQHPEFANCDLEASADFGGLHIVVAPRVLGGLVKFAESAGNVFSERSARQRDAQRVVLRPHGYTVTDDGLIVTVEAARRMAAATDVPAPARRGGPAASVATRATRATARSRRSGARASTGSQMSPEEMRAMPLSDAARAYARQLQGIGLTLFGAAARARDTTTSGQETLTSVPHTTVKANVSLQAVRLTLVDTYRGLAAAGRDRPFTIAEIGGLAATVALAPATTIATTSLRTLELIDLRPGVLHRRVLATGSVGGGSALVNAQALIAEPASPCWAGFGKDIKLSLDRQIVATIVLEYAAAIMTFVNSLTSQLGSQAAELAQAGAAQAVAAYDESAEARAARAAAVAPFDSLMRLRASLVCPRVVVPRAARSSDTLEVSLGRISVDTIIDLTQPLDDETEPSALTSVPLQRLNIRLDNLEVLTPSLFPLIRNGTAADAARRVVHIDGFGAAITRAVENLYPVPKQVARAVPETEVKVMLPNINVNLSTIQYDLIMDVLNSNVKAGLALFPTSETSDDDKNKKDSANGSEDAGAATSGSRAASSRARSVVGALQAGSAATARAGRPKLLLIVESNAQAALTVALRGTRNQLLLHETAVHAPPPLVSLTLTGIAAEVTIPASGVMTIGAAVGGIALTDLRPDASIDRRYRPFLQAGSALPVRGVLPAPGFDYQLGTELDFLRVHTERLTTGKIICHTQLQRMHMIANLDTVYAAAVFFLGSPVLAPLPPDMIVSPDLIDACQAICDLPPVPSTPQMTMPVRTAAPAPVAAAAAAAAADALAALPNDTPAEAEDEAVMDLELDLDVRDLMFGLVAQPSSQHSRGIVANLAFGVEATYVQGDISADVHLSELALRTARMGALVDGANDRADVRAIIMPCSIDASVAIVQGRSRARAAQQAAAAAAAAGGQGCGMPVMVVSATTGACVMPHSATDAAAAAAAVTAAATAPTNQKFHDVLLLCRERAAAADRAAASHLHHAGAATLSQTGVWDPVAAAAAPAAAPAAQMVATVNIASPLVLRVSYADVELLQDIGAVAGGLGERLALARETPAQAAEAAAEAEEARRRGETGAISDLPVPIPDSELRINTHRAANNGDDTATSRAELATAGAVLDSGGPGTFMAVKLTAPCGIEAILIDNSRGSDVPMISATIAQPLIAASLFDQRMLATVVVEPSVRAYNPRVATWEPILEPTTLLMVYSQLGAPTRSTPGAVINAVFTRPVRLVVSAAVLAAIMNALAAIAAAAAEHEQERARMLAEGDSRTSQPDDVSRALCCGQYDLPACEDGRLPPVRPGLGVDDNGAPAPTTPADGAEVGTPLCTVDDNACHCSPPAKPFYWFTIRNELGDVADIEAICRRVDDPALAAAAETRAAAAAEATAHGLDPSMSTEPVPDPAGKEARERARPSRVRRATFAEEVVEIECDGHDTLARLEGNNVCTNGSLRTPTEDDLAAPPAGVPGESVGSRCRRGILRRTAPLPGAVLLCEERVTVAPATTEPLLFEAVPESARLDPTVARSMRHTIVVSVPNYEPTEPIPIDRVSTFCVRLVPLPTPAPGAERPLPAALVVRVELCGPGRIVTLSSPFRIHNNTGDKMVARFTDDAVAGRVAETTVAPGAFAYVPLWASTRPMLQLRPDSLAYDVSGAYPLGRFKKVTETETELHERQAKARTVAAKNQRSRLYYDLSNRSDHLTSNYELTRHNRFALARLDPDTSIVAHVTAPVICTDTGAQGASSATFVIDTDADLVLPPNVTAPVTDLETYHATAVTYSVRPPVRLYNRFPVHVVATVDGPGVNGQPVTLTVPRLSSVPVYSIPNPDKELNLALLPIIGSVDRFTTKPRLISHGGDRAGSSVDLPVYFSLAEKLPEKDCCKKTGEKMYFGMRTAATPAGARDVTFYAPYVIRNRSGLPVDVQLCKKLYPMVDANAEYIPIGYSRKPGQRRPSAPPAADDRTRPAAPTTSECDTERAAAAEADAQALLATHAAGIMATDTTVGAPAPVRAKGVGIIEEKGKKKVTMAFRRTSPEPLPVHSKGCEHKHVERHTAPWSQEFGPNTAGIDGELAVLVPKGVVAGSAESPGRDTEDPMASIAAYKMELNRLGYTVTSSGDGLSRVIVLDPRIVLVNRTRFRLRAQGGALEAAEVAAADVLSNSTAPAELTRETPTYLPLESRFAFTSMPPMRHLTTDAAAPVPVPVPLPPTTIITGRDPAPPAPDDIHEMLFMSARVAVTSPTTPYGPIWSAGIPAVTPGHYVIRVPAETVPLLDPLAAHPAAVLQDATARQLGAAECAAVDTARGYTEDLEMPGVTSGAAYVLVDVTSRGSQAIVTFEEVTPGAPTVEHSAATGEPLTLPYIISNETSMPLCVAQSYPDTRAIRDAKESGEISSAVDIVPPTKTASLHVLMPQQRVGITLDEPAHAVRLLSVALQPRRYTPAELAAAGARQPTIITGTVKVDSMCQHEPLTAPGAQGLCAVAILIEPRGASRHVRLVELSRGTTGDYCSDSKAIAERAIASDIHGTESVNVHALAGLKRDLPPSIDQAARERAANAMATKQRLGLAPPPEVWLRDMRLAIPELDVSVVDATPKEIFNLIVVDMVASVADKSTKLSADLRILGFQLDNTDPSALYPVTLAIRNKSRGAMTCRQMLRHRYQEQQQAEKKALEAASKRALNTNGSTGAVCENGSLLAGEGSCEFTSSDDTCHHSTDPLLGGGRRRRTRRSVEQIEGEHYRRRHPHAVAANDNDGFEVLDSDSEDYETYVDPNQTPLVGNETPNPVKITLDDGSRIPFQPCARFRVTLCKDFTDVTHLEELQLAVQEIEVAVDSAFLTNLLGFVSALPPTKPSEPAEAHAPRRLFIETFALHPISIVLSVDISEFISSIDIVPGPLGRVITGVGAMFAQLDDASIKFPALFFSDAFMTQQELVQRLVEFYKKAAIAQLYRLIGSLSIIGNPTQLISSIGGGFSDASADPFESMQQMDSISSVGFRVMSGAGRVFSHTIYGISTSLGGITGGVGDGLAALAGDRTFNRKRQVRMRMARSGGAGSAAAIGLALGDGFSSAVTGLWTQPQEGFAVSTGQGVAGIFRGIAGLVIKPVTGVFDAVSSSFEAIKAATGVQRRARPVRVCRGFTPSGEVATIDAQPELRVPDYC